MVGLDCPGVSLGEEKMTWVLLGCLRRGHHGLEQNRKMFWDYLVAMS